MNTSLPTNVTAGTPDLPGMLNQTHGAVNTLSRSTGERDVTSFLTNGWTASRLTIRRTNDTAVISVTGLNGAAKTNDIVFPFSATAPGVSPSFVAAGSSRRSPLFQTADGGQFYFALTSNTFRCFFLNGLTSTGSFRVDWVISNHEAGWPSFLPPAV